MDKTSESNTKVLAGFAIFIAFIIPPVGAIMGHVAYRKPLADGTKSKPAILAIVFGWSFTLMWVLFYSLLTVLIATGAGA